MTDKIYWSDFPEEVQKHIETWLDDPLTQERLAALEKTYEVIMQEYNCTREEAVQRHLWGVFDNISDTEDTLKIVRKEARNVE